MSKDCNVKTYKEHIRLFFNPAKKSWYIPPSTSEQTAVESDVESLNSSLASEEHDSSDGGSSMFEETKDLTSSAISHQAGHAGELYLNYHIPPAANDGRKRWEGASLVTFLTSVSLVMLFVEEFTRDQEQKLENCATISKFLLIICTLPS